MTRAGSHDDSRLTIGVAGPVDLDHLGELAGVPTLSRGLGSPVINRLIGEFLRRGHAVNVFTLSPEESDIGCWSSGRLTLCVGRYRRRLRWVDAFRSERRVLIRQMRANPCDVLHAHWTNEFAMAALRGGIAPVLVTVHDWGPAILRRHRHPYRLVRLLMQVYVLARAPRLTANSPYIAEKVRRGYRRDITVIPNGIEMPDDPPARLDGRMLVIGSLNNGFGELKNVQRLIDAFALIRVQRPDAVLRLVGIDFEPGGPAETYARSRGSVAGIEFVGPIPAAAVASFMRSLDVLVHPSLEESFGMTLVEAIVEGTLVVAGRSSGAVPWVLGNGTAGTLVDVRRADAIAAAVLDLPAHEGERSQLRQQAFEHVRTHFSLDHVVDEYERIYRQITR